MSTFVWNCWALGNPRTVNALREYVTRLDPKIVFLLEMKMKIARLKRVKAKIDYANGFNVQREGKGGGLALFWRKEVDLEIKSYLRHNIDAVVTKAGSGFRWRLIGFYGHPETYRRKESWNFLATLNNQF